MRHGRENNEIESRGQNIRIPITISYSDDNDFLTEHHEDVIDRPSNEIRGRQRQDKSPPPSWGPLRTVHVIMIEVFRRSGPNRAAALSTSSWLVAQGSRRLGAPYSSHAEIAVENSFGLILLPLSMDPSIF